MLPFSFYLNYDYCIFRAVISRLMCDISLDYAAMGIKWAIDFEAYCADAITQLNVLSRVG